VQLNQDLTHIISDYNKKESDYQTIILDQDSNIKLLTSEIEQLISKTNEKDNELEQYRDRFLVQTQLETRIK
jgi:hypothetical protein